MKDSKKDKELYNYFTKLRTKKLVVPPMTNIAKETCISHATISRYAKRKGYSSFAVLRDDYNKKRTIYRTTDKKMKLLIDNISKAKHITIIPSNSCYSLGFHVNERMKKLGIKVELRPRTNDKKKVFDKISQESIILFITLSTNSAWYESYVKSDPNHDCLLISTRVPDLQHERVTSITHIDKAAIKNSVLERNISRGKLLHWLDQCITQLHLFKLDKKM